MAEDENPRIVRQFKPPVRRSRVGAWLDAGKAVRCGVHLSDYLTYRLRQYLGQLPQNPHPLPVMVSISGAEILVQANPNANDHPLARLLEDPAGVSVDGSDPQEALVRWLRATHEAEAQIVGWELSEAEEEYARLSDAFLEANERLSEMCRAQQEEIADGGSLSGRTMSRSKRDRGRPSLGVPRMLIGSAAATAVAIACEAYQFALPYYDLMGIDSTNLTAEWQRNASGVLMGAGFAATASGALLVFGHWLFETVLSLYAGGERLFRTAMKGALAAGLATALAASAYYIGDLRHGAGESSSSLLSAMRDRVAETDSGTAVFVLLTALVPLAVAWMWHKAKEETGRRRQVRAEQRLWDEGENQKLELGERRDELIDRMREEREQLTRLRSSAREKIRELGRRAQAAEQWLREKVETERRFAVAFAGSLIAALERDRFYFVRAAHRRGQEHLIAASALSQASRSRGTTAITLYPVGENGGSPRGQSRWSAAEEA